MITVYTKKRKYVTYKTDFFHLRSNSLNLLKAINECFSNEEYLIYQRKIGNRYVTDISFEKGEFPVHANSVSCNSKNGIISALYEFTERYFGSINNKEISGAIEGQLLGQLSSYGTKVNSNGLAIGNSIIEAQTFGLMELLERETFLNYWYLRRIPAKINDFDRITLSLIKDISQLGYEVCIYNLENNYNLKIVWVIVFSKEDSSIFSSYTTTGCSFSLDLAMQQALKESFYGITRYQNKEKIIAIGKKCQKEGIKYAYEHPCLYALPDYKYRFSFLDNSTNFILSKGDILDEVDLAQWLSRIKKYFLKRNWSLKFWNFENENLYNKQLFVVKAFSPNLQPLIFGNTSLKNINLKRLKDIESTLPEKFYLHPYT